MDKTFEELKELLELLEAGPRTRYSLYQIALLFSSKQTPDCITNTLLMLIDDVNSGLIKAWHGGYCNYIHPFTATEEIANEIWVEYRDFSEYLYGILDRLIKENSGYTKKSLEAFKGIVNDIDSCQSYHDLHRLWRPYIENAKVILQANLQSPNKKREQITTKKLRPSQRAREKCREVAKKLWKKYPLMRIDRMVNEQEILDVSKRPNGDLYENRTVRNWIKDLCPYPRPGRPKK